MSLCLKFLQLFDIMKNKRRNYYEMDNYCQMSLFNLSNLELCKKINSSDYNFKSSIALKHDEEEKLKSYDLKKYIEDINILGLKTTWDLICEFILKYGEINNFLRVANFGEMYEIGLAIQDKDQKKKRGQYYTPDDVALVMSKWLDQCTGKNICDVACGTGKLILTYLSYIGFNNAKDIINGGRIYLYESDPVALKICKTSIILKYKIVNPAVIHDVYCDFLDKEIVLPTDTKVISNPPYSSINQIEDYWENTNILLDTSELYSAFMEKVFIQASSTVIITPFSFVSGNKFYSLRKFMCGFGNGFIVSFDNVPGNIFCGRKQGVFNTNTANSVRAAITVFHKDSCVKGFKVSPLIRFKNEERSNLLQCNVLEKTLPNKLQLVSGNNKTFAKIDKTLEDVFTAWINKSKYKMSDTLSNKESSYSIYMPNTCRYYTTASHKKLTRTGFIKLHFNDKDYFNFAYCFINSSFAYWWWRIYDGGITYPMGLLKSMPIPINLLTNEDRDFFAQTTSKLIEIEEKNIIIKKNAGANQENIKFPVEYRNLINNRLLEVLGINHDYSIFRNLHANRFFN